MIKFHWGKLVAIMLITVAIALVQAVPNWWWITLISGPMCVAACKLWSYADRQGE